MFTKQWLSNLFDHLLLVVLATFFGGLSASGLNWLSLSNTHAALVTAGAAGIAVVQGALAALLSPPASSTAFLPRAAGQRLASLLVKTAPAAAVEGLTKEDLDAAIDRLGDRIAGALGAPTVTNIAGGPVPTFPGSGGTAAPPPPGPSSVMSSG